MLVFLQIFVLIIGVYCVYRIGWVGGYTSAISHVYKIIEEEKKKKKIEDLYPKHKNESKNSND